MMIVRTIGLAIALCLIFQTLYGQQDPCDPKIACTEIYVMHHIGIADFEGCPVILDEYISRNMDTGKMLEKWKFNPNDDMMNDHFYFYKDYARYLLLGDNRKDQISQCGTTVRFVGKKKGKVIVDRDFLVGHDCCHITFLEGDREIEIDIKKNQCLINKIPKSSWSH